MQEPQARRILSMALHALPLHAVQHGRRRQGPGTVCLPYSLPPYHGIAQHACYDGLGRPAALTRCVALLRRLFSTKQRAEGGRAPKATMLASCAGRVAHLAVKRFNFYANEYTALYRPGNATRSASSTSSDQQAAGSGEGGGGGGGGGEVVTCSRHIAKLLIMR